jgi:hypothetical protein
MEKYEQIEPPGITFFKILWAFLNPCKFGLVYLYWISYWMIFLSFLCYGNIFFFFDFFKKHLAAYFIEKEVISRNDEYGCSYLLDITSIPILITVAILVCIQLVFWLYKKRYADVRCLFAHIILIAFFSYHIEPFLRTWAWVSR